MPLARRPHVVLVAKKVTLKSKRNQPSLQLSYVLTLELRAAESFATDERSILVLMSRDPRSSVSVSPTGLTILLVTRDMVGWGGGERNRTRERKGGSRPAWPNLHSSHANPKQRASRNEIPPRGASSRPRFSLYSSQLSEPPRFFEHHRGPFCQFLSKSF